MADCVGGLAGSVAGSLGGYSSGAVVRENTTGERYIVFTSASCRSRWSIRWRVRYRTADSDSVGAWSDWTVRPTETIPITSGTSGHRVSAVPFTLSAVSGATADVSLGITTNDYADLEIQIYNVDSPGGWFGRVFDVSLSMDISPSLNMTNVGTYSLALGWDWVRSGGYVTLGVYTDAKYRNRILDKRYYDIPASGCIETPATDWIKIPTNGQKLYLSIDAHTLDYSQSQFGGAVTLGYTDCNTPSISTSIDSDTGAVEITVGDTLDKGYPITGVTVIVQNGDGVLDTISGVTLGTAVIHAVPPLDETVTYVATATNGKGAYSYAETSVVVPSDGYLIFNHGSDLSEVLKLAMNVEWDGEWKRASSSFDPANSEDEMVFYGRTVTHELTASGDVFYPQGRDDVKALAKSHKCVFRAPHGERRKVTIDSVKIHDSADQINTDVDIDFHGVR